MAGILKKFSPRAMMKKTEKGAHFVDCETCYYYDYDEEWDTYICLVDIDEDDYARMMQHGTQCPYYRQGDDYYLARKQ